MAGVVNIAGLVMATLAATGAAMWLDWMLLRMAFYVMQPAAKLREANPGDNKFRTAI
jgi:hypothetical protein